MAKYFEVTVTVQHEVDGGKGGTKIKKVKESYLVDAMTVTEAEARVVGEFEKAGIRTSENNIIEIFKKDPNIGQNNSLYAVFMNHMAG